MINQDVQTHELKSKSKAFKGRLPELLGTYVTCQAKVLNGRDPEVEEAAQHVWGCDWCTQNLFSIEQLRKVR